MSLIDDNKIEYQMNMNQLTKLSFIQLLTYDAQSKFGITKNSGKPIHKYPFSCRKIIEIFFV